MECQPKYTSFEGVSNKIYKIVTFLLFQSNLYIVLAHGKGPKNIIQSDFFKTEKPKQKNFRFPAVFYTPCSAWIGF